MPIVHDGSALPLSGEFLAKPELIVAETERVRVASMSRYGIGLDGTIPSVSTGEGGAYGAFFEESSYCDTAKDVGGVSDGGVQQQQQASEAEAPLQLPGGGTMARSGRSREDEGTSMQYVVIIRHGKTGHNKLGLFTGWEDVSLADEGRAEAVEAGRMLRRHGVRFDVVYTSWLSRAIETAWLVLVELDAMWLPIRKSWRLNERMYGALTGLSKKKTRTVYGQAQFMKWRRSYDTKPPAVSSFSSLYPGEWAACSIRRLPWFTPSLVHALHPSLRPPVSPLLSPLPPPPPLTPPPLPASSGNDQRYVDNVVDVRWSVKESVIRSLERGRLVLHRKLPRTESLKDCMERTIPYYINAIEGDAIKQGKSVLIASSENAIRGLLMHLLRIPEEEIINIEIPTGLPLVFDMRHRCLKLLEGEFSDYNFGTAAELLFTPCEIPDDEYAELDFESSGAVAR